MLTGRTLLHYRILDKIGSGGMGDVYAAEDTKLRRTVALKVLPEAMASDAGRLARFEREATAIAALNHPHIITIHSIDQVEGIHFLTMELIRGRRLTDLIPKDGLPLGRLIELALPLADAVSAAHLQGITHRDLKPDNVMVGDEGRLKVLDFGLAKLVEEANGAATGTQLPTTAKTEEGTILGTLSYMAPEQVEGRPADARSDVFSLGVVIYEMATGRRPFGGGSKASLLAAILRDTPPPVTEVNRGLPRDLQRIVRRCLAKDPLRRYQTALEVRNELEDLERELASGVVAPGPAPAGAAAASGSRPHLVLPAAVIVALSVVAGAWLLRGGGAKGPAAPETTVRGRFSQVTSQSGPEEHASLSPDGKLVAFAGASGEGSDIFVQRIGGQNAINLTNDPGSHNTQPAFSPDGESIAFRSEKDGGGIFVMGATGESIRRLTSAGCNPAWSPDARQIVYAMECFVTPVSRSAVSELWVVPAAGDAPRRLYAGDAVQPRWSPHGQRIAFWAIPWESGAAQRDIWTIPAAGGTAVAVTDDAALDWNPVWSPDGRWLYFSSDRGGTMNIWRVAIDEDSGRTLGPPQEVTNGVSAWSHSMSLSADGRHMAYVSSVVSANVQKIGLDPKTAAVAGEPVWVRRSPGLSETCTLSPDDGWLVCATRSPAESITIMRTDGTDRRELVGGGHKNRIPRWSADGNEIFFYSDRSGSYDIWRIRPDGAGLTQVTDKGLTYPSTAPDGRRLLAFDYDTHHSLVIDLSRPFADQTPDVLEMGLGDDWLIPAAWSPDGRLLGCTVLDSRGRYHGTGVYDLASRSARRLSDFGNFPAWFAGSRRLLFGSVDGVHVVDVESGAPPQRILSVAPDSVEPASVTVSRDGRTLYFSRASRESDVWLLTME